MQKVCMTNHAILHGLVVMAVDSQSEGPGIEYQSSQILFWHFSPTSGYLITFQRHVMHLENFSTYLELLLLPPCGQNWNLQN